MIAKPLLDINVCLGLLLKQNPHLKVAAGIFQQSENEKIQAVISAISFDTLAYVMHSSFSTPETTKKLKEIASIVTIGTADTTVIQNALNAGCNDIEDTIQYHSTKENNCDVIISRNIANFAKSSLPVFTSFEFLGSIEN